MKNISSLIQYGNVTIVAEAVSWRSGSQISNKSFCKAENQPASVLIPSLNHLHSRLWNIILKIPTFIYITKYIFYKLYKVYVEYFLNLFQ